MERIKQALDRTKKLSGETVVSAQPNKSGHKFSPVAAPAQSQQEAQSRQELEAIKYSNTRVVTLKADHLEKNRIVAYNKSDAMSMNFDLLRTQVLQRMKENGWRTLAITSPAPEAGKTVVAINLAMSIAQQTDKTAMLVDFDLRRPKVGTYLGLPMERSLNDLLSGATGLSEILINPDIPRLVILPTKNPVLKSSETLSSRKISDLIRELRERYESRIVIFDLPPVLVIDDALALLPQIDCVLMVIANGMSTRREIEDSLRHIPAEKLLGTVFNKAEIQPTDKYYY